MTDFSFLPDDSEFTIKHGGVTPYDILEQCRALLEERGRMRDKENNILESSFKQAADIANSIFYGDSETITELNIMEMMIALKLARMSAAIKNGKKDIDSMLDIINYLALYVSELENHYC